MRFLGGAAKARVRHAALSDVGKRREKNEDAFAVIAPGANDSWGFQLAAVVCDGVGGQPRGEMASQLAVAAFRSVLGARDERPLRELLDVAAQAASAAIADFAAREVEGARLATTVVALVIHDGRATVGHVGDSRAYRLRGRDLEVLTRDHSFVAEQVRAGVILPSEARTHPLRSRLSRALGIDQGGAIEVSELTTERGDLFLLCSDGLHAFVEEAEILKVLGTDLERSARKLIDLANAAGGIDNITVALCRVE